MVSREKLKELVPESGTYEGSARMSFRDPDGSISGRGTIRLLPDGQIVVRIDVEQYSIPAEYHDFLMAFLQGSPAEHAVAGATSFRIGGIVKTGNLEVSTADGNFRSEHAIIGQSHFDLLTNENAWFEVVPYGLELSVGDTQAVEMWCVPLFGDLGEFQRCANACLLDGRTPYIHFEADGNDCGLLIFNSVPGSSGGECSAVVFGRIGHRPHGSGDEVSNLIPSGLFAALGFASGSDIRAPCVELRSRNGELRHRFHLRFGGSLEESGFPAFSRFDSAIPNSGIAEFLRLFFQLPQQQRRSMTPTLSLVRRGTPGSATVDESITNLIKSLDATCGRQGFGRINLAASLDAITSQAVSLILTEARDKLKKVRRQCKDDGRVDQLAILDKIVSRQANSATDELDFGIALSGLLSKFHLADGRVMESYYSALATDATWEGLLSFIRGEVVHLGAIYVENRAEIVSWFELARHLHDICKRVILREIGYNGTYLPSNVLVSGTYALDRVTPSTTPAQLGYTVPPTVF